MQIGSERLSGTLGEKKNTPLQRPTQAEGMVQLWVWIEARVSFLRRM